MEEDSLEVKQNFLRESILNKGYDTDLFMNFLAEQKPEAAMDINNFSLSELRLLVEQFCSQNQPYEDINNTKDFSELYNSIICPNSHTEKSNSLLQDEQISTNASSNNETISSQINPNISNTKYIKCKRLLDSEISKTTDIKITVSDVKVDEFGYFFFASTQETFLVTTSPFQYKVRRSYSDFKWLRNYLQKQFLFSAIPPIPKDKNVDKSNEKLLKKRMRSLEKFMNGIMMDQLVRKSNVIFFFLSIKKENEWKAMIKELNELKTKSQSINAADIITLNGKLECEITPQKEEKFNNIKKVVNANENAFLSLISSYKELRSALNNVIEKLKIISEIWNKLYSNNIANEYEKNGYMVMKKYTDHWINFIRENESLVNLHVIEYLRYRKNENISFKEILHKCEMNKNNFLHEEEKLLNKKELLFNKKDFSKWELPQSELQNKLNLIQNKEYALSIMLPTKTENVYNLKLTYGSSLNVTISEYNRLDNLNKKIFPSQIKEIMNSKSSIVKVFHDAITEMLTQYN